MPRPQPVKAEMKVSFNVYQTRSMMSKKLMWGALMAIAFASCTQEDVQNNVSGLKSLDASVENNADNSRVGFADGTAAFFWTTGDMIGVTTSASQTFQKMTLEGAGGDATGTFNGTFNGTPSGYAVYPYGEQGRHSIADGVLTYALPAEYTYDALDTEYAKANGNSHNAPMWGNISEGSVAFKHLGGTLAFFVDGLPENTSNMQFVLTATNQISGSFTATLTANEPVIVSAASGVAEADKKVTIRFSTATGQTSGYFYVPVPTGSLGNLALKILDGEEEVATGAWDNITIARKDIKRTTLDGKFITGGETKELLSIDDITDEVLTSTEDALTVEVTEEVTGTDNTITIPASMQTEMTTFSFASVADGATITIENATGASYTGQIIIEVPEGETIPTVNANIPEGEVYIKQGTVTNLVVSSADNTTIVGANAKIGTLTVNKGNVKILKGGEIGTIVNNTGKTLYIINVGGTILEELPEKTIVVYEDTEHAVVLDDRYSTDKMDDMLNFANDMLGRADNLTLVLSEGEHKLSSTLSGKNIVLEGASKEGTIIKVSKSYYFENSVITLKNLTYSVPTGLSYTEQAFAFIHHAKEFNLTNCIVDGRLRLNVYKAIIDGCQFDITTSSGFDGYSLYYYGKPNSEITVSNSTFNTAGKAIVMYNESAVAGYNLTVEGCTFISSNAETDKAAIQMHTEYGISGALTINESTATGFADINGGLWNELKNNGTGTLTDNFVKTIDGEVQVQTAAGLNKAATAGATVVALAKGTYNATDINIDGKTLTLKGIGEGVKLNIDQTNSTALGTFDGSKMTFENLTISTPGGNYKGFARMEGTYNNCTFENLYFTFYGKHTFNGCVFNANSGEHCIWTYGANDVAFNDCDFNYTDRCVNVYNEAKIAEGKLTFTGCDFITNNESSKGAVEINSGSFTTSIKVDFDECAKPAYGEMVFISGYDSANGSKATVTIGGTVTTVPQLAK